MAEGDRYFGYEDRDLDRDLDKKDNNDNDDEQEVNTTREFQPGWISTPYHGGEQHEMQTMQHEQSELPETSYEETPLLLEERLRNLRRNSNTSLLPNYTKDLEERLRLLRRNAITSLLDTRDIPASVTSNILSPEDQEKEIQNVKDFIKKRYANVNFETLGPIRFSFKKPLDIVVEGPRGGEKKIVKDDGSGLRADFLNQTFVKKALGPKTIDIIAQENVSIREERQRLREAEKQLQEAQNIASEKEKAIQEAQDLRIRIERTQAQIEALTQEHGSNLESDSELRRLQQLKKNYQTDFENAKKEVAALEKQAKQKAKEQTRVDQLRTSLSAKESERNTLQERLNDTRALDDLKEQEAELKRQNDEDQAVIQDENTSPTDKQAAEERVAERTEELARLQTQIAERERALPLRERIKEIFKKNGVTVTAIFLAAGVTIGAVIGAITNSLKATGKAAHLAAYPCCGCFSC
ncbi:hypothetical protein ACROYT_G032644 [Oculina patagonica]